MEYKKNNSEMRSDATPDRRPVGFVKKLLINIAAMCGVFVLIVSGVLYWLDSWTLHGQYQVVPEVKGRPYDSAISLLRADGFDVEITDSLHDRNTSPGMVMEQNPKEGTKVKPGRTVYLIINALSPKSVSVPSLTDISIRQARSILEGLGINNIKVVTVPSEFKDLVLGARSNNGNLQPGVRIPVTSAVVLEVGDGLPELPDSARIVSVVDDSE